MSTKNQIVLILVLLFIGFVLLSFLQKTPSEEAVVPPEVNPNEAVLILDYGDGRERIFTGEVVEDMTSWEALQASSQAGNFDIKVASLDPVLEILSVNGEANNGTKKWQAYLNGEKIVKNPQEVVIKPGDEIRWKYE